jgi:hypothetical protein
VAQKDPAAADQPKDVTVILDGKPIVTEVIPLQMGGQTTLASISCTLRIFMRRAEGDSTGHLAFGVHCAGNSAGFKEM